MKRILRILVVAILTMIVTPAMPQPGGGGCGYPEPNHFCGLACRDYWCLTPASQSMYCIEVPGGCGSMQNACCKPF
jgi:hypothetical protein